MVHVFHLNSKKTEMMFTSEESAGNSSRSYVCLIDWRIDSDDIYTSKPKTFPQFWEIFLELEKNV